MAIPKLAIVDGGKGLEAALNALWPDVPVQRCTVYKHRNLLAHAPKRLHEEITAVDAATRYLRRHLRVSSSRRILRPRLRLIQPRQPPGGQS
jgi:transposase-like protein